MPLPIKITGLGRYAPMRVVTNKQVEVMAGVPEGTIDKSSAGVVERRWADDRETNSWMGAQAALEAVEDAGLELSDIDLIINASGTQEQVIPDGACLIQRELGLGDSGIGCFSVHSTCLSFLSALNVAAGLLVARQNQRILIVSSDVAIRHIDKGELEIFSLIGDLAAAAVVERTAEGEGSAMTGFAFSTFAKGADLTYCNIGTRKYPGCPDSKPEDNYFHMKGRPVFVMALTLGARVLEELKPGLSRSLDGVDLVVPHQASGMAVEGMVRYGWPLEKIVVTLDRFGNTNSSSMPGALYEAKATGRLKRGDKLLLAGTGAGLSIGAALLTY